MTSLISVKQINSAREPLLQAYRLSVQIEAMDGFAPEKVVDQHRRQLGFQMEQIAARLGYDLIERNSRPRIVVDNDSDEPVTMGR